MKKSPALETHSNSDLVVSEDNKSRWNLPGARRHGFRNLYRIARYGISMRSDHVLSLNTDIDQSIGQRDDVQNLIGTAHFTGMVVLKNQRLLYERYAGDFAQTHPHTIMSISKMTTNLILGELISADKVDRALKVKDYIPEIGTGYAEDTVQQVLDMDLENDYSEDYSNPQSTSFNQEASIGWRLPAEGENEITQKEFLCSVKQLGGSLENTSGYTNYKSANTDLLGWIAERVSGRPLRDWILDIVEAVGIEGNWHMHTDRTGFPVVDGGVNLCARDLARFGQLFCRHGAGVRGRRVGNADYIEATRKRPGTLMPPPMDFYNYSNQTMTNGTWLGHGGYGGQFLLANPDTGVSVAFFSVLQNKDAMDLNYQAATVRMMESLAAEY